MQIVSPFLLLVLYRWAVEESSSQRFEDGAQRTEGRTVALLKRSEKCTGMILHPMTEGNSCLFFLEHSRLA